MSATWDHFKQLGYTAWGDHMENAVKLDVVGLLQALEADDELQGFNCCAGVRVYHRHKRKPTGVVDPLVEELRILQERVDELKREVEKLRKPGRFGGPK